MSDLLSTLKAGTDNVKLIKFPKSETPIALKILNQKELQDAAFCTERLFKTEKIDVNLMTSEEYSSEKATQILFRCIRDPENLEQGIAPNITVFRASLTRNEKEYLIGEYLAFEKDVSPSPDNMSNEEFDKILLDVKKNPEDITGKIFSSSMLKKLITTLVSQLKS
jgi:hypothetical protein